MTPAGSAPLSNPILGTLGTGCASPTRGIVMMPPPTMMMNARRSISLRSLDDFVGSDKNGLRDGEAQSSGSLEVDHQLELGGLFDREIARLAPAAQPRVSRRSSRVGRRGSH